MRAAFAIVRHPGHIGAVLTAWERQCLIGAASAESLMGIWCEDLRGSDDGGTLVTMERLMLTDALGPIEAVECGGRWAICMPEVPAGEASAVVLDALRACQWPSEPPGPGAAWFQAIPGRSAFAGSAARVQGAPDSNTFGMPLHVGRSDVPDAGAHTACSAAVGDEPSAAGR